MNYIVTRVTKNCIKMLLRRNLKRKNFRELTKFQRLILGKYNIFPKSAKFFLYKNKKNIIKL